MNEKTFDNGIKILAVLIIAGVAASAFFFYKNRVSLRYKNPPILDQQIEILEKKIKKNPGNFDLRILIAKRLIDRDRTYEAIGHLEAADKIKKKSVAVNYLLGFAYNLQDNTKVAKKKFEAAIKIGDKEQFNKINTYLRDANFYLAGIYFDDKDYDKALKSYKIATEIGTADSDTLYKVGQIYALKKDYKNAMDYYGKALAFVPNYNEVLVDFDKALKKLPSYGKGYYDLGKAYQTLGQLQVNSGKQDDAKKSYKKAKTLYQTAINKDSSIKEAKTSLVEVEKLIK